MIAGLPSVFRFLLILMISYYLFKFIVRYLFPILVRNFVKKAQKNFYDQNPHLDPEKSRGKEGEIHVKKKPDSQEKSKDDFGDYIDYEEIKE